MSTPLPLLEPQKTQQPADPSRAEHKQENKKTLKIKYMWWMFMFHVSHQEQKDFLISNFFKS